MKSTVIAILFIAASVVLFTQCGDVRDVETEKEVMKEKVTKVAILVGEGFHDGEAYMPMAYLANRGVKATVIGPNRGEVKAYNSDFTIKIQKAVTEVSIDEFDGLILPGGHAPAKLRENDKVLAFVQGFFATGKPTAAICHGPQVLISAGLMEGKTCTAFPDVEPELSEAGATFVDEPLVVDGNLITSRVPQDLHYFSEAIYKALMN